MLNENIEYKEYTDKKYLRQLKTKGGKHRLDFSGIVKNDNSGLRRALLVIAKHLMNENGNDYEKTQNALAAWLGYEKAESSEAKELYGYFKPDLMNYYVDTGNKNKNKEEKKKSIKIYLNTQYKYFTSRFKTKSGGGKNYFEKEGISDQNLLNFEDVYYTVKGKKPRNRVLVCDTDLISSKTVRSLKKKELRNEDIDHVLKIIAAYLLNRIVEDASGVSISKIDIGNWSLKGKNDYYDIQKYLYENRPIVEDLSSDIIHIDDELMKHFRLVDVEDLKEEIRIGDVVYVDKGKQLLQKYPISSDSDISDLMKSL